MRTLLLASLATLAFAGGASAQLFPFERQAAPMVAAVGSMAPTEISRLCGVDYAINDPDPNIRLELRRQCSAGIDGGSD